MNKYVLKATALAIGALVGGSAVAAVTATIDFDASSPTVGKFAKELNYTASTLPSSTPLAGSANQLNFKSKLGFGVSSGQTRYIRVDFGNAKLNTAMAAVRSTDIEIVPATPLTDGVARAAVLSNAIQVDANTDGDFVDAGDTNYTAGGTVALVQGGQVGDSYAVYQITAGNDASAVTDSLRIKVPALAVTSTSAPVTATYSLHETAASAQGATPANTAVLYNSGAKNIATFDAGLVWTLTPATATATVEQNFKQFGANKYATLGTAQIGAKAGVLANDGNAVTLAQLTTNAGTKVAINGDFGASVDDGATPAVFNGIYLDTAACSATPANKIGVMNTGKTQSVVTIGNTAATYNICYAVVGGSTGAAIAAQTITAALDVTATAAAGGIGASSGIADVAAATAGNIVRDGTELIAPFATIYPGTGNRAVLTSQHSADAAVVASVITENGVTCSGGNANYTLLAGKQLFINASDVCPTLSAGTRFALKFVISAPNSKVNGVYNSYTYDAVTTKVTDLSSYPLQRPAN